MATWSDATLESVLRSGRTDAEYFLPEFQENQHYLEQIPTCSLPSQFLVSDGNHLSVSKYFSNKSEIPYYRGQDITDFFIGDASPTRIPLDIFNSGMMRRSHFRPNDVLVSIVGTIGSLCLFPAHIGPATGSCKIAILRSKGAYLSSFLTAFLLSKYGQLQIKRNTRGAVQMGLILKDFPRIRIPIVSALQGRNIGRFVSDALQKNAESRDAYKDALRLLESELGLDKLDYNTSVGYEVGVSEMTRSFRADAEFYDPMAKEIIRRIRMIPHTRLDQSFSVGNGFPWRSSRFLLDNSGEPVVRIRDIRPSHINTGNLTSIVPRYASSIGVPKAKAGDVVVGMDGIKHFYASMLTGSAYVNQRVAHLTPRLNARVSPEYATFILNSNVGQAQLMRDMTVATTVGHITNRDIRGLVIPTVSRDFHDRITELVTRLIHGIEESKRLLENAKAHVEQMIEEAVQS